jgi:hypothetical protein
VIAIIASAGGNNDKPLPDGVYDSCKQFVEGRLKYPGSSTFEGIGSAVITIRGNAGSEVSYVDAANAFGAKSRRNFVCEVHYTGNGNWRLTNLDLDLSS